jgi:hypothetical protein
LTLSKAAFATLEVLTLFVESCRASSPFLPFFFFGFLELGEGLRDFQPFEVFLLLGGEAGFRPDDRVIGTGSPGHSSELEEPEELGLVSEEVSDTTWLLVGVE